MHLSLTRLRLQVHRLIAPRDQKYQSNFVEFRSAPSSSASSSLVRQNLSSTKIVYRRYAGLFFCVCVDANDNELAYLEAIHFFVEVLDQFFGNVCELDLVFNFYKVSYLNAGRSLVISNQLGTERIRSGVVCIDVFADAFTPTGICNSGRSIPCWRDRGDEQTSRPDAARAPGQTGMIQCIRIDMAEEAWRGLWSRCAHSSWSRLTPVKAVRTPSPTRNFGL